jgi:hypothetical protein
VATSSSSAKKVAKLAQKGKGKKVRFQGGTLFPLIVAIVVVLGLGLVTYGRASRPAADDSPPTIDDHWHHAYGFYVCDQWLPNLVGNLEEIDPSTGAFINADFNATGIHSHDDGVIHWHANSSRAVGKRATLGLFLDVYDVQLTDSKLTFPENQGGATYEEGEYKCGNEDGELKAVVWDSYTDTDAGTTYISDFNDIRLNMNSMVVAIAFVPKDTDVAMPPQAAQLPELGAVDQATQPADVSTTVAGGTTPAGGTDTTAPASTAPSGTDAPATTTASTAQVTTTTTG